MVDKTKTREVRCCCDARLIGYLPRLGVLGDTIKFSTDTGILDFEIQSVFGAYDDSKSYQGQSGYIDAYKSQDYPLKQLRTIPGWEDA